MCTKCCCSNCAATCQKCPLGVKPDANQTVNVILGLGGEAFKWVFNMYDKCYTPSLIRLVEKAMKKVHRPVWRPVGPMAVPTFSNKLPLAMKRGRNRQPGTSSSSTAGSRVLKLAVHAEEEDSVSEVNDGNGSNAAVEDDGPIQLLNDLLL